MSCDVSQWNYHGPKHKGHKGCMREGRQIDAKLRGEEKLSPKDLAEAQAKRGGEGVDDTNSPGQGRGSMVSEVPRPPSLQRERRNQAGRKIRETSGEKFSALAMSEKFRRSR
jgi:hypothetical protein